MPGDFGATAVNTRVHSTTTFAHEAAGALRTRHPPRPLFKGVEFPAKARARRAAGRVDVSGKGLPLKFKPISPQPLPCQLRPRAERHQFGFRDIAMHRRHAAIGGRDDVALRHEL
jgi:hypothetical protein